MIDIELGSLLADASQAAAYFVDIRDRAALVEAANALDFTVAVANLAAADDKDALLDQIAEALQFPATFGGNWDALADSLGDLSWLPAPGYVLLLDHCADLRDAAPDDFATLLDILDEAATAHARAGVPFWALLPVTPPDA
ncbi:MULTISPECIES: barstar family protein [unclassified Luteimonas]